MRETHPLFGQVLMATTFRRWQGVTWLVVRLCDGSSGTVAVTDTDVLGPAVDEPRATILSADGLRHLRVLIEGMGAGAPGGRRDRRRK